MFYFGIDTTDQKFVIYNLPMENMQKGLEDAGYANIEHIRPTIEPGYEEHPQVSRYAKLDYSDYLFKAYLK